MKKIIAIAVACFISATAFCQSTIAIDSASAHVGGSVTVCSKVYGVKSLCLSGVFRAQGCDVK